MIRMVQHIKYQGNKNIETYGGEFSGLHKKLEIEIFSLRKIDCKKSRKLKKIKFLSLV
jgi:hypothetical protein